MAFSIGDVLGILGIPSGILANLATDIGTTKEAINGLTEKVKKLTAEKERKPAAPKKRKKKRKKQKQNQIKILSIMASPEAGENGQGGG